MIQIHRFYFIMAMRCLYTIQHFLFRWKSQFCGEDHEWKLVSVFKLWAAATDDASSKTIICVTTTTSYMYAWTWALHWIHSKFDYLPSSGVWRQATFQHWEWNMVHARPRQRRDGGCHLLVAYIFDCSSCYITWAAIYREDPRVTSPPIYYLSRMTLLVI